MLMPTTYYRPSKGARVLPVDDQLDYLTGHYRHLTGTTKDLDWLDTFLAGHRLGATIGLKVAEDALGEGGSGDPR